MLVSNIFFVSNYVNILLYIFIIVYYFCLSFCLNLFLVHYPPVLFELELMNSLVFINVHLKIQSIFYLINIVTVMGILFYSGF